MNQGVTVGGRLPLAEDDLWWKMTFGGRRSLVEDNLSWKMTFGGIRCSLATFSFFLDIHAPQQKKIFGEKIFLSKSPWNIGNLT